MSAGGRTDMDHCGPLIVSRAQASRVPAMASLLICRTTVSAKADGHGHC